MKEKINSMYFSATGTTKKIVSEMANRFLESNDSEITINNIDFTIPEVRKEGVSFTEDDIVILGVPVYAGRIPNVLIKYLNSIVGNGAFAIPVVVYGNRNYDDALIELKDILELNGFKIVAAGAFIGEHAFSESLAKNRPDEKDMAIAMHFADDICKKINTAVKIDTLTVNGNKPYRNYYLPKDSDGNGIDIRKVIPRTNNNCTDCKLCVNICPMGSIDFKDVSKLNGICIKCCACIKKCPTNAKYFDDEGYLQHKLELEVNFQHRREIELFI